MPTGEKYFELTKFLENSGKDSIGMSFDEVKEVLGFDLGNAAYSYPAAWSNTTSHSLALGWLNAGYRTENVDMINQHVTFIKDGISKNINYIVKIGNKAPDKTFSAELPAEVAIKNIRDY